MKSAGSLALAICLYLAVMSFWAHSRSSSVLHGRVTAAGQPVAHATLSLFLLRPKVPGAYARNLMSRTGENGTYEVATLPKGDYVLLIWKHGIRLYQGRVHVREAENVRDIALENERPAVSETSTNWSPPQASASALPDKAGQRKTSQGSYLPR